MSAREVSAGIMCVGVAAATAGSFIEWGLGVALLVMSGLLIGIALLIGWE